MLRRSLKKADVIPDVLAHSFKPSFSLLLSYPSTHDHVFLGNVLPPANVSSKPIFEIHSLSPNPTPTQKNATYTLVLTDPDATSRAEPVKAQMCHWIVTGLKLQPKDNSDAYMLDTETTSEEQSSTLPELVSYFAPAPPPKTGYHRYIFVLLTPKDSQDDGEGLEKPADRPHWGYGEEGAGVKEWADDNGLEAVGEYCLSLPGTIMIKVHGIFGSWILIAA
ncbi:MAG: hypothetical protein Q9195_001992 [Heterodermia aff. obscurata]